MFSYLSHQDNPFTWKVHLPVEYCSDNNFSSQGFCQLLSFHVLEFLGSKCLISFFSNLSQHTCMFVCSLRVEGKNKRGYLISDLHRLRLVRLTFSLVDYA